MRLYKRQRSWPRIDGFQSPCQSSTKYLACKGIHISIKYSDRTTSKKTASQRSAFGRTAWSCSFGPAQSLHSWHSCVFFKLEAEFTRCCFSRRWFFLGKATDSVVKCHRCLCKWIATGIEKSTCKTLLLNQLFEEQTLQPGSRRHSPMMTTSFRVVLMQVFEEFPWQLCLFPFPLADSGIAHLKGQQSIRLCKCNAIWQWQCSSIQMDLWNSFLGAPTVSLQGTVLVWLSSTCGFTNVRGLGPELMVFNHHVNLLQSTWLAKVSTLASNIQAAPRQRKQFPKEVPFEEQPGLAALAQEFAFLCTFQVWGWVHEMFIKASEIPLFTSLLPQKNLGCSSHKDLKPPAPVAKLQDETSQGGHRPTTNVLSTDVASMRHWCPRLLLSTFR